MTSATAGAACRSRIPCHGEDGVRAQAACSGRAQQAVYPFYCPCVCHGPRIAALVGAPFSGQGTARQAVRPPAPKIPKPFGSAGFRSFLVRRPPAVEGGLRALNPSASASDRLLQQTCFQYWSGSICSNARPDTGFFCLVAVRVGAPFSGQGTARQAVRPPAPKSRSPLAVRGSGLF